MKKIFAAVLLASTFFVQHASAQDVHKSQVPSLIINNFQKAFPKVYDVEWELEGENYKAEFETGLFSTDHDAWYSKTGKLIRHKEEISKNDLPKKVLAKLSNSFSSYRVEDVKKITENNKVTYTLELKTFTEEWKAAFDNAGNILSKVAD